MQYCSLAHCNLFVSGVPWKSASGILYGANFCNDISRWRTWNQSFIGC
jgi:hypothetical protein